VPGKRGAGPQLKNQQHHDQYNAGGEKKRHQPGNLIPISQARKK